MNMYAIPKNLIIGDMRNRFRSSLVAKEARARYISDKTGPKGGLRYKCPMCGDDLLTHRQCELHHIDEIVPVDKVSHDMSLDGFADRIWCIDKGADSLIYLCKPCHRKITNAQNEIRRLFKNAHKKYLKRKKKEEQNEI